MQFDRPVLSLVELAVLKALGVNRFTFQATRPAQAVVPGPFRTTTQTAEQSALLREEMQAEADGSWTGDGIGDVYGTAVALIILQLPYNRLSVYQR